MRDYQKEAEERFKKMEELRTTAEKENRKLTPQEIEQRNKLKKEIEEIVAERNSITDEKELRSFLYGDTDKSNRRIVTDPGGSVDSTSDEHQGVVSLPKGKDYRSMFGVTGKLDRGGFKSFDDFLSAVASGRADDRLKMDTRAMGESTPSAGGFSVPEEMTAWLLDQSLESEIIRPRATVWPLNTQTRKVPGFDMSSNASSLFGGLTASWMSESGTAGETYAKLRQIELIAKKLACYTSSSNELVADGITFEQQLGDALIKTVGFYLDYAFIQGPGAGEPLGIINDPALITISKEINQTANTIMYENLLKMFARIAPQCLKNAIWLANSTAIPQLLNMSVAIGTGGAFIPAVTQQNGKFYLLTRELVFTEKCPALGSKGDIILADLSQYTIGLRKEVSLDKSNAPGWLRDESSYRAIVRADGQGSWNKAVTPKNGDTLSWCTALAARQ
jgi:HK97 family phage major capsid protein